MAIVKRNQNFEKCTRAVGLIKLTKAQNLFGLSLLAFTKTRCSNFNRIYVKDYVLSHFLKNKQVVENCILWAVPFLQLADKI